MAGSKSSTAGTWKTRCIPLPISSTCYLSSTSPVKYSGSLQGNRKCHVGLQQTFASSAPLQQCISRAPLCILGTHQLCPSNRHCINIVTRGKHLAVRELCSTKLYCTKYCKHRMQSTTDHPPALPCLYPLSAPGNSSKHAYGRHPFHPSSVSLRLHTRASIGINMGRSWKKIKCASCCLWGRRMVKRFRTVSRTTTTTTTTSHPPDLHCSTRYNTDCIAPCNVSVSLHTCYD